MNSIQTVIRRCLVASMCLAMMLPTLGLGQPANGVVALPALVQPLVVKYPEEARRQGIEGRVLLRVRIGETGLVREARLYATSGSPSLDAEAVRAVSGARFKPVTVSESRPADYWYVMPINFVLDRPVSDGSSDGPRLALRPGAGAAVARTHPIVLSVPAEGAIYIGSTPVASPDLEAQLSQIISAAPGSDVHIRADRATRYERIVQIMTAAERAGASSLKFVVEGQR